MEDWLVLGEGGGPGIDFRVGLTWGPPWFSGFLKNKISYIKAKTRFEICIKFAIQ
jgi:hypothetical protein